MKRQRGSRAEVARLLLCDKSTVGRWTKTADFPHEDEAGKVDLFDAAEWYFRRRILAELDSELSSSASNSEGLERYRLARAQMAEIELAKVRCEIVSLRDCEEALPIVFLPWRRIAEHCKRTENHEMMQMIEEANASVLAGLERFCSGVSDGTEDTLLGRFDADE